MTGLRFGRAAGMIVAVLGVGGAIASASDQTPQEIIESFGLVKKGKLFLLPKEESEVMEHLNGVLPLVATLDELFNQWAANENLKAQILVYDREILLTGEEYRRTEPLLGQLDSNRQIAKIQRENINAYLQQLRIYDTNLRSEREVIRGQIAGPRVQQEHLAKVTQARDLFLQAYNAMLPSLGRLMAAYDKLKNDPKVKNAMKTLLAAAKGGLKFGPSDGITKAMREVNRAKNTLDPKVFQPQKFTTKKPPRPAATAAKASRN